MTKAKIPIDQQFEKVKFDLFEALAALDRKDYDYYETLTSEQKKKFSAYMMLMWMSTVSNVRFQKDYILNTNKIANIYFFSETVQKHPKLQWLMLCASSPLKGKQYHKWIPHIRESISKLQDNIKKDELEEYYKKVYPTADAELLHEIVSVHTNQHNTKMYLGQQFPNMKFDEIELLSKLITDNDIEKHKKENGE